MPETPPHRRTTSPHPVRTRRPAPTRTALPFLLAASAILAGCESSGDGATVGGRPGDEIRLSADDLQVVGTSEVLSLVRDLKIDTDGTVWVLNNTAPFLVAFDPDGGIIAEIGEQGEGPRELRDPVTLAAVRAGGPGLDGVWLFDRARHAMVRVSAPGLSPEEALTSRVVPFPPDQVDLYSLLSRVGGMPMPDAWIAVAGRSVLAALPADGSPRGSGYWTAQVHDLSLADSAVTVRWDMTEWLPDPEDHHPGATEFIPMPLWAFCPDGSGWLYDPVRHRVRPLSDPEAEGIELPAARHAELTADRMFELLVPRMIDEIPNDQRPPDDQLRDLFEREIGGILDRFADEMPEYFQMQCGTDGTLWLQELHWAEGYGGAGLNWVRLPAGGVAQVIRMPDGFRAMRFTDGRAWGIVRDELDIPSLTWIGLPMP